MAIQMFENLSRMELDILGSKINRAVQKTFNLQRRTPGAEGRNYETYREMRKLRSAITTESESRIAL